MKSNNHESIEDLFPFYALGSLSDDERERVEVYLDENPEAQERLREMMEVASALAYVPEPLKPPAQLKERLLDEIRARPREPQTARRTPIAEGRIIGWFGRNRAATALAILGLFVAATSAFWAVTRNAQIVELRAELAGLEATISQQNEIISRISLPGVQAVDVLATNEGSQAGGRLFVDPEAPSGVLFVWGLAPLSPEESYQVWLIAGENPVSAGFLPIQDQGGSVHLIEASRALQPFDAIGVSIEPVGGSDLPIGPIVLFAGLAD
ncbi:MAG: anti-sigma factor [Chloroflexi bacterium]|nr:anti-sigma factor [Chloroflexota bacterium]